MTTAKNPKRPQDKSPAAKRSSAPAKAAPAKNAGGSNKKSGSTPISKAAGGKPAAGAEKKSAKKIPWLGIVFGVVALALVAAIVFSSDKPIGTEAGEPELAGESLPPFSEGAADPAIGMAAPVVQGEDFDGNAVSIGGAGTPMGVVFLAHWCPHCQVEVPRVQQWLDAGGGVPGVEIRSVATSMNSARENYPPSAWLEREGWTSPVMRDSASDDALLAYGAGAFPYWVFLDADGNVVRRSAGELSVDQLEAYLEEAAS